MKKQHVIEVGMYRLECTCSACPEQYDVFIDDTQVGYLRLRHGIFRADYPKCGGDTVYEVTTVGDGEFQDEAEREFHINNALSAIGGRMEHD